MQARQIESTLLGVRPLAITNVPNEPLFIAELAWSRFVGPRLRVCAGLVGSVVLAAVPRKGPHFGVGTLDLPGGEIVEKRGKGGGRCLGARSASAGTPGSDDGWEFGPGRGGRATEPGCVHQ